MSTNGTPAPRPWRYFIAGSLTAILIFVLGAASWWAYSQIEPQLGSVTADAETPGNLFDEAWKIINDDFIGPLPSPTERTYGAIRGSIETLGDPYTYFIEPEPAGREQEQLQGHFGGIGAFLALHEDGQIHLDPMIDRPAFNVGVQKDDILIAVDGETLPIPADLDAATNLLRGPVETVVRITVQRSSEVLDFSVTREQIELPSVRWRPLPENPHIGYIRIERFSALTDRELGQAIDELKQANAAQGLLLDLRQNPGGLLDAAIAVSGHFLDGGPVLEERLSDGSTKVYNTTTDGDALDLPVVILVDAGTASAAEIMAGALQDRNRAQLVGETTYGKGSIQRVHRLSDDSALHITYARWYTPGGHQLDDQGLSPDVTVAATDPSANPDPLIQTALDLLR